jgi:hypothetical protein
MNTPMVPSDNGKVASLLLGKNVLKLKQLADLGDELVARLDEIREAARDLHRLRRDANITHLSIELPSEEEISVSEHDREQAERARALLELLDPDDAYTDATEDDNGGGLKRSVIASRLSMLLEAFASGAQEGFALMLLEHVAAADDVTFLALQSACADLEVTRKSPPSIAAVMDALHEHQSRWDQRRTAIYNLVRWSERWRDDLRAVRAKIEAEKRARAIESAAYLVEKARKDLITKQAAAAKLAQEIAEGFERLRAAEENLRALQADD